MELWKGLEHKSFEGQLEGAGGTESGEKEAQGEPYCSLQPLERRMESGGDWCLLPVIGQEGITSGCARGDLGQILWKIAPQKGLSSIGRVCPGKWQRNLKEM